MRRQWEWKGEGRTLGRVGPGDRLDVGEERERREQRGLHIKTVGLGVGGVERNPKNILGEGWVTKLNINVNFFEGTGV